MRDLLTPLFLWLFYNARRERWGMAPDRKGTASVIRPAPGLRGLGWAWLVWVPCASWVMVNGLHELRDAPAARWVAVIVTCVAVPFGASLILRARRSFVLFNGYGVIFKPTIGTLRHVSWNQLRKLEYWPIRSRLVFRTKSSALTIRVGFAGFAALLDQARQSLPKSLWVEPLARVERDYLNGFGDER